MRRFHWLVFVCLALMLASCSFKQTWGIHGKWKNAESNEIIEFAKNGVMTLENEDSLIKAAYKLKDPKHIQISFGSLATLEMQVKVTENELTLIHADGTESKYVKVK